MQLAGFGARQTVDKGDGAWILVWRNRGLDVVLQRLDHGIVAGEAGLEHDKSLDDTAAVGIRHANTPAFGDRLVLQQRLLDLRASNVVARGDTHVGVAHLVKQERKKGVKGKSV